MAQLTESGRHDQQYLSVARAAKDTEEKRMINTMEQDTRWEEFRTYTEENSMTKYERRLLRDWVRSGHSVYETVESRYLPGPAYPPMDYLDAYRFDRELREDMRGMTDDEKEVYLKSCMGWKDPSPEELAMHEAKKDTPKVVGDHVRKLERELFNLWCFIWQEGLGDDARAFVEEHKDDAILTEW